MYKITTEKKLKSIKTLAYVKKDQNKMFISVS